METHYNEHCKAQARTIQWICQMLAEHEVSCNIQIFCCKASLNPNLFEVSINGEMADYGCGPGKNTIAPTATAISVVFYPACKCRRKQGFNLFIEPHKKRLVDKNQRSAK